MNPLLQVAQQGQSIWLHNLSRALLREGRLDKLIEEGAVSGVTSDPVVFHRAVSGSLHYQKELARLRKSGLQPEARYESLAVTDVREACDVLSPIFEESQGDDGYVSMDVSPFLARDVEGAVAAGQRLNDIVNRRNLLIRVPATQEGFVAAEELVALGINVNMTLMFSLCHTENAAESYMRGARRWVEGGGEPGRLKSVASFFLSRIDTAVDRILERTGMEEIIAMRGLSAIALAKLAYRRYREIFHGRAFADLAALGVRPQNLLWASTGTKNPSYSDVHYMESLIGPETVSTLPDATLAAFRDHGKVDATLERDQDDAEGWIVALGRLGVDMSELGEELQAAGLKSFELAFGKLLRLTN